MGHRRKAVRAPFVAIAAAAVLALVASVAAAAGIVWRVTSRLHPDYRLLNAMSPTVKGLYVASFLALAVALGLGFHVVVRRRLRAGELFAGSAALLAALAILAAAYLPGASFLFAWPLLVALSVGLGLGYPRHAEDGGETPAGLAAAVALGAPPLILVTPFLPQLVSAFGLDALPAVAGLAALMVAFAAPAARIVLQPSLRVAPLAAAAIAAACFAGANLCPSFDREHPRPDSLVFAVDADGGHAWWLSPDPAPDAWTAPALAGAAPQTSAPLPFPIEAALLVAPASSASAEPAPVVTWLTSPRGEVHLRVAAPAGTELLAVHIDGLLWARVEDRVAPLKAGALEIGYFAPPAGGVLITAGTASDAPVTVRAVSQRSGFPSQVTPPIAARPPSLIAKPGMMPPWNPLLESDSTLVAMSATR